MSRVLVLAGGSPHAHDFAATGQALVELVASAGHRVITATDPDAGGELLQGGDVDALVLDGLWWQMEDDAYAEWRADHAYRTPARTREAFSSFVDAGGGLLALHTAPVCFDDWPEWANILGAAWQWGVSGHPPFGPVVADVIADHPIVVGMPNRINLQDEVYGGLKLESDIDVLMVAKRDANDEDQPVVWTRTFGAGRVVFNGFGHNAATIRHPDNARVLTQSLDWILEDRDATD